MFGFFYKVRWLTNISVRMEVPLWNTAPDTSDRMEHRARYRKNRWGVSMKRVDNSESNPNSWTATSLKKLTGIFWGHPVLGALLNMIAIIIVINIVIQHDRSNWKGYSNRQQCGEGVLFHKPFKCNCENKNISPQIKNNAAIANAVQVLVLSLWTNVSKVTSIKHRTLKVLFFNMYLSLSLSFCWSGHVFSSLWSIVSKVKSLKSWFIGFLNIFFVIFFFLSGHVS